MELSLTSAINLRSRFLPWGGVTKVEAEMAVIALEATSLGKNG
jgi:hypothetical protein